MILAVSVSNWQAVWRVSSRQWLAFRSRRASVALRPITTISRRPVWKQNRSTQAPFAGTKETFSTSSKWSSLQSNSMSDNELTGLAIDKNRLMTDIHYTCQWGTGERWGKAPTETGMSRLALSDSDAEVRGWFMQTVEELGCEVSVDGMGNIFAVRPGLNKDAPATFVGSHLDTQPAGGRYDGILGVHAGIEILKVLNDCDVETLYPIGVVNWTNEEGARFPKSMIGSGVWAGDIPLDVAHNLKEVHPGTATMGSELKRIAAELETIHPWDVNAPCSYEANPMAAHFELHIEQGPLLEMANKKIGIVTGVQAYKWLTVTVKGRDTHTGTTDLKSRADALLTASKMILHSHKLATENRALASTGILNLAPGSTNTVPGSVTFSLDIRAPQDSTVARMKSLIEADFPRIAAGENVSSLNEGCTPGLPLSVSIVEDFNSPATTFHPHCIDAVGQAADAVLGPDGKNLVMKMTSGAGHDSVYASKRCPTSMVFVPCRGGVSHNPEEFCTEEDCATGTNVLMQSVLRFDRGRKA